MATRTVYYKGYTLRKIYQTIYILEDGKIVYVARGMTKARSWVVGACGGRA